MTKYRPRTFEEVKGQPLAVKLLKAVAKNPERSVKSLVLWGPWGTGKTSLARIFARSMACTTFKSTGKVCMRCEGCLSMDNRAQNVYYEYDSSQVGNVQQIKEMKPVFSMLTKHYRVICIDEAHLLSRASMGALLKVLEEGNPKTFFLFVSTDPDKILKTIHSRSLPVELFKIKDEVIATHLREVSQKEGFLDIPDHIYDKIAFKSDGHMRDAVRDLSAFALTREESVLNIPIGDIHALLRFISAGDMQSAQTQIATVMEYPLYQIQKSLNFVVMKILEAHLLQKEDSVYFDVSSRFKDKTVQLFKLVSELWVQGVFSSVELTYSFMLTMLRMFLTK